MRAFAGLNLICLLVASAADAGAPTAPTFAFPTAGTPFPVADRFIKRIEIADVNGDGKLDVVSSDNVDVPSFLHFFNVFLNNGDGTLAPPVQSQVETEGNDLFDAAIALGDLNEDGRADLVTTRLSKFTPPQGNRPNIAVLFGAPDGHFVNQINIANSSTDVFMRTQSGRAIALADMNGDTHLDIVSAASNGPTGNMSVLLGNGNGTFQLPIQSGNGSPHGATVTGDLDGDGDLDVVTYTDIGSQDHANSAVFVDLNNGSGTLTGVNSFTVDAREDSINIEARAFLKDLDADGKADLILFGDRGQQTGAGGIYIRKSLGSGQFTQVFHETRAQDANRTFTILLDDYDGDGDFDLAKVPNPGQVGEVLLNNGGLANPVRVNIGPWDSDGVAATGNLAGNQLPDIALYDDSYTNPRIRIAINTSPAPIAVGDFNSDGQVGPADLAQLLAHWGQCGSPPPNCPWDLTNDGAVGPADLAQLLAHWG